MNREQRREAGCGGHMLNSENNASRGSGHIQPKTSVKDLDLPPYSAMAAPEVARRA